MTAQKFAHYLAAVSAATQTFHPLMSGTQQSSWFSRNCRPAIPIATFAPPAGSASHSPHESCSRFCHAASIPRPQAATIAHSAESMLVFCTSCSSQSGAPLTARPHLDNLSHRLRTVAWPNFHSKSVSVLHTKHPAAVRYVCSQTPLGSSDQASGFRFHVRHTLLHSLESCVGNGFVFGSVLNMSQSAKNFAAYSAHMWWRTFIASCLCPLCVLLCAQVCVSGL